MNTRFLLLAVSTLAGSASAAAPAAVSHRTFHYTCDGGKKISASYVNFGKDGPMFVVLHWNGRRYGLAEAVSASGARYAGLRGPTSSSSGLEWWEHQGQATLNSFVGSDLRTTQPLLTRCKTRR